MSWEQQRQLLTDVDFLLKNSSDLMLDSSTKGIFKDFIISRNLNLLQFKAKMFLELKKSQDREKELNEITSTSGMSEFYAQVKRLKSDYPDSDILVPSREERGERDWEDDKRGFEKLFTAEEGLGHYLDLVEFYNRFLNLKVKRINYLSYVKEFYDTSKISENSKNSKEYKSYVKDLCLYMETFIAKTNPLQDLDEKKSVFLKKFEKKWEAGEFEKNDPLYCTACQKQFTKETVFEAHKSGKKHIKAVQDSKDVKNDYKNMAILEFLIKEYTVELQNVIEETVFHVERKQTLTEKERMEEAAEEPVVISDVESDDSEALYNPLKLPMGWDGKPIPYWLYKLHGLGVEYKCEICGNFVYMGRKAFEGHFAAFRHIYGLRCLGITNTRHFAEITSIQDALDLWERLQNDEREEEAARDAVEEYEDDYGNVFNKKTYEDQPNKKMVSKSQESQMIRLMIQCLSDLGLSKTVQTLENESQITLESLQVSEFRTAILNGDWNNLDQYFGLLKIDINVINNVKFLIYRQKYLELLEKSHVKDALFTLRHELTPLGVENKELHKLSSLIMLANSQELMHKAGWNGINGNTRNKLLKEIQAYIPPHIMIPEHRLQTLMEQAEHWQKMKCVYHSSKNEENDTLYSDHHCGRNTFPIKNTLVFEDHADEVWFVAFSNTGKYLASASKDSNSIIWDVDTWKALYVLSEHKDAVSFLAWSPNDLMLLTASNDHTLKLWDVSTGTCTNTFSKHVDAVTSCAWLPNCSGFVSGSLEKVIYLWNIDGTIIHKWAGIRVMDLSVTKDGKTLIATSEKKIRLYNLDDKTEKSSFSENESITSVFLSSDNRYLLVNLSVQEIHLWDLEEKRVLSKYIGQRQGRFVIRSCFGGAYENFILSGSEDSHVYVWSREHGTVLEVLSSHTGCVNCVTWNQTRNIFASASDDHSIRIWSAD